MSNAPTHIINLTHYTSHPVLFQDESGGSLSTGSGLDLDEGEEGEEALGADLRDDDHLQPGSDDDF
jgi:hypothetical protein